MHEDIFAPHSLDWKFWTFKTVTSVWFRPFTLHPVRNFVASFDLPWYVRSPQRLINFLLSLARSAALFGLRAAGMDVRNGHSESVDNILWNLNFAWVVVFSGLGLCIFIIFIIFSWSSVGPFRVVSSFHRSLYFHASALSVSAVGSGEIMVLKKVTKRYQMVLFYECT